jgi:pilus assembly protein CpaE
MPASFERDLGDTAHIPPLPRVAIQAFCETSEIGGVVQAASADRRMDKTHVRIQMGGGVAAVEAYKHSPTPNVIIIESVGDRAGLLTSLDQLAEFCDPGTKVLVIGHVNDVVLYRELMRRGVSDYLIAPIGQVELIRALSELFHSPDAKPLGRTIAVLGTRGGIGASTIAHNVAWGIARGLSVETVVVDFDLPFGTAGLDFNQDPPQGVADAIFAPDRLDANLLDRLLATASENLSLLAAPATLDRSYDIQDATLDTLGDLLRASAPAIVYDIPHMWTTWVRKLVTGADEIVLVASPDLASLRNAKNFVELFKQTRPQDRRPHLVMNMVGVPKRPEIAVAEFGKALDLQPAAKIDFAPDLFGSAANNGQMIAEVSAKSRPAETFRELASLVMGRTEGKAPRKSLLEPLLMKLNRKKA